MLGIEDLWVWLAYLLCIVSAVLCVTYGLANWNRGNDSVEQADVDWAAHQDQADENL